MYKTILVPLDGSKRAENILRYVEPLAAQNHSTIVLMQVVEPNLTQIAAFPDAGYFYRAEMEARTQETKQYLAAIQGKLQKKQIECKSIIESGPIVQAILQTAERENASLIALASHGRTGMARLVYGSVAAGVLHQSVHPLLIVRAE